MNVKTPMAAAHGKVTATSSNKGVESVISLGYSQVQL
jgi:hypothetical protein